MDQAPWLIWLGDPSLLREDPGSMAAWMPSRSQSLARGVELLLRGDAAEARSVLEAAREDAARARDGAAAHLALMLSWLAEVRSFNLFPGGVGAGGLDLEVRWNGTDRAGEMARRAQAARGLPGAREVSLQARWIEFLAGLPSGLAIVRSGRGHPQAEMLLQLQIRQCEHMRDDARALPTGAMAFIDRCIAELLMAGRKSNEAEAQLKRALAVARDTGDDGQVAACLALLGDWLAAPGNSALVGNLELVESGSPTSELAWPVEADEGAEGAERPGAQAAFAEALSLCERAGAARGAAALLLRQAYLAAAAGERRRQVELTAEAAQRFAMAGDALGEQLARARQALAALDEGVHPEDRETAKAIGEWGRTSGSFSFALGLGILFSRAGRQALLRAGDYERAEASFGLALALNEAMGARLRVAQTLGDLASLHQAVGNRDRAVTDLDAALEALNAERERLGSSCPPQLIQRTALLAQQLYRDSLDHKDAEGMDRALQQLEQVPSLTASVAGLGITMLLESTKEQGSVLIPLYRGVEQQRLAQHGRAEAWFEQAFTAAQSISAPDRFLLSAVVQAHRRSYAAAVESYDRYLEASGAQPGFASALLQVMARLSPSAGQREVLMAARRSAEQSFSFMVRAKSFGRAAEYLKKVEESGGDRWWSDDAHPWRPLSDVGEMHEGLGRHAEAVRYYQEAIDQLESRRALLSRDELKTALAGDLSAAYLYFQASRAALRLAASEPDPLQRKRALEQAFILSERARARGLLDLLSSQAASGARSEQPDLARWRELTAQCHLWRGLLAQATRQDGDQARRRELVAKIERGERELHEKERALFTAFPEVARSLQHGAEVSTLAELADSLSEGTALLEYMSLGDDLLLWAVTSKGMEAAQVVSVKAADLARDVRDFREGCAKGVPIPELRKRGEALSRQLIAPLEDVIDRNERLVIVPYGELHRLPFAALIWRGAWLGEQRTLSYLPSASVRMLARGTSRAPYPVLAIGNPSKMRDQPPFGESRPLDPLPYAEGEAARVAELYGAKPLSGKDATEARVKPALSSHRILHFATHGLLYENAPLMSGVALADGDVLTVYESMGLHLDADLVTLSACKTGLGAQTGGEEVVGLTRGLLAAGARAALVTLWAVLDGSTAVLMTRFYERLKAGDEPALALRQAQAAIRSLSAKEIASERSRARDLSRDVTTGETVQAQLNGAHPRLWAPFVLTGA